jgi:TrmH family RNA methyltransferase
VPAITSRANPRVKDIRALRNRRERERTGLFLAEGVRVVREGLRASAAIETLLVVEERVSVEERKLVDAASSAGAEVVEVSAPVYDSLSFRGDPDSVAAVVRQRHDILPDSAANDLSWTAVDGIQHPGNLGTLIRTSDAAGGAGIVLTGQSTDPYHPVAVRGSLGAIFSQRVVTTTLEELEQWLKRMGSFVTGTSPSASARPRCAMSSFAYRWRA